MSISKLTKLSNTIYFYPWLFLPKNKKEDIKVLYQFISTVNKHASDLSKQKLEEMVYDYEHKQSANKVLQSFLDLESKYELDVKWTQDFFKCTVQDLEKPTYKDMSELGQYLYSTGEVTALYIHKILQIDPDFKYFSQIQGRAVQLINLIANIHKDLELDKVYIPLDVIKNNGLSGLTMEAALSNWQGFCALIDEMIDYYYSWQREANVGLKALPNKLRLPIMGIVRSVELLAKDIKKDPHIVFYSRKGRFDGVKTLMYILTAALSR